MLSGFQKTSLYSKLMELLNHKTVRRFRPLYRYFKIILINLVLFTAVCEAAIYLFPKWIPTDILASFPSSQRQYFAKKKELNTTSMYQGDQYLYSLNATCATELKKFHIDELGFRNPKAISKDEEVDVVFLGDSLMIAEAADMDLASLARKSGLSAYNLGMGGYSPLHYALAYDKYIIGNQVKHKYIVLTLCLANDVKDMEQAIDIYYTRNKSYVEYLNKGLLSEKKHYSILTFLVLKGVIKKILTSEQKKEDVQEVEFQTPYAKGKLSHLRLRYMGIELGQYLHKPLGDELIKCINSIITKANQVGAKCIIVMMPNWDGLYSSYIDGYEQEKQKVEADYALFDLFFRKNLKGDHVFLNARLPLKAAAKHELVTGSIIDYHLNTKGVEVLYDFIKPNLR